MTIKSSAGLATYLAGSVREARRRYRKRLARSQKKFSEGAVHELRVEMRRILALLDLLTALRLAGPLQKLARNFKKRLDVFDELRDTQVQLRLLRPWWRDFPEARPLRRLLERREDKLVSRVAQKIKDTKYVRLHWRLKQVEKCLDDPEARGAKKAGAKTAASALHGTFQRVAALRQRVRRNDPATIHRLRVAFKRFRYMSELLQPLLPGLTTKQLGRMKEYQAAAGDIQDIEVLLARLTDEVRAGELKSTDVRKLQRELLRRRRRVIGAFMKRIDDLFAFKR